MPVCGSHDVLALGSRTLYTPQRGRNQANEVSYHEVLATCKGISSARIAKPLGILLANYSARRLFIPEIILSPTTGYHTDTHFRNWTRFGKPLSPYAQI